MENYILRHDRTENVQRINRANEYHRERMMQKIKIDNEKCGKMQEEKMGMMEHRRLLKQQIDADKHMIYNDFELMKMGKVAPEVPVSSKYFLNRPLHRSMGISSSQKAVRRTRIPNLSRQWVNFSIFLV